VVQSRGPSDLCPNVKDLPHPAAHLLGHLEARGAPVVMKTGPWSAAQKASALRRGPHKSALEHVDFLRQELVDMIHKGQWTLLPAAQVLHMTNLRLSPLGVVPQRDRRPRTISDYSFFDVNDETCPLAPLESMQFGRALHLLLQRIAKANPRYGPVYLSKLDIADGFYRIRLLPSNIPKLGDFFPKSPGKDQPIALPFTLPMGWIHSPPCFCASTETIADLANAATQCTTESPAHRLEATLRLAPCLSPTRFLAMIASPSL
jgi:hypothetical protein